MLIKCPECGLQISDKAISCPHCGYPIIPIAKRRRKPYGKPRRLPNGFGRITKISNQNLRNPYRVMVTVGKTEEGRPISKILKPKGYFRTYNEAYEALVEYNKNPYDLGRNITMDELFDRWSKQYFETVVDAAMYSTISSWRYCSNIKAMRVIDVRARHLKGCIYEGEYEGKTAPPNMKTRIKTTFNLMLDYAVEYELVDRNYARTFTLSDDVLEAQKEARKSHMIFTDHELNILWDNLDIPYVDVILIQCYTGWRPQELGLIKLENINLEKRTIIGGLKTKAGKNRIVPICSKIYPLISMRYSNAKHINSEYLINCTNNKTHTNNLKMTYAKYYKRFNKIIDLLNLDPEHKPHDGRKTFVTMAKKAKVDEYAIKYIIGHAINDLTEEVYTERDSEWLLEEVEKIR